MLPRDKVSQGKYQAKKCGQWVLTAEKLLNPLGGSNKYECGNSNQLFSSRKYDKLSRDMLSQAYWSYVNQAPFSKLPAICTLHFRKLPSIRTVSWL